MEKLSFQVAEYDAPLDLILHLIGRHKLSITDIDISSLLDQYMHIIRQWQEADMEVASEFLEMASRLVYMKTVGLLPRHEEEIARLRRDLSGELMEYRLCKIAAERLGEIMSFDSFVRDPVKLDIDPTYRGEHSVAVLYDALRDAMGRGTRRLPPPRESFDPIVTQPVASVTAKIFAVLRALRMKSRVPVRELFSPAFGRSGIVATFLAVLELMRSGKIRLEGDEVTIRSGF